MPHVDTDASEATAIVEASLDPGRTALVIVDMQNCFVADSPSGRGTSCGPTAATSGSRREDPCGHGGVINEDEPTAALHGLMGVHSSDVVVDKPRFGSFYGTDLEVMLLLARHRHAHPRRHQHQRVR